MTGRRVTVTIDLDFRIDDEQEIATAVAEANRTISSALLLYGGKVSTFALGWGPPRPIEIADPGLTREDSSG